MHRTPGTKPCPGAEGPAAEKQGRVLPGGRDIRVSGHRAPPKAHRGWENRQERTLGVQALDPEEITLCRTWAELAKSAR